MEDIFYNLTVSDLAKLVRQFQADNYDGFVSNDEAYVENWLKKHAENQNILVGCSV